MEIKISWSFFVERLREILRIPRNFFQKVEKEKGRDIALSYFSILLFIKVCLTFLEKTVIEPVGAGLFPSLIVRSGLAISLLVVTLVMTFIFEIVLSFVGAGVLHIWIKLFKGKGSYDKSYQLYVYASTPSLLLSWLPFLGIIGWLYGIYLLVVGTQVLHSVSKTKAILIYILPVILFILAVVSTLYSFFK